MHEVESTFKLHGEFGALPIEGSRGRNELEALFKSGMVKQLEVLNIRNEDVSNMALSSVFNTFQVVKIWYPSDGSNNVEL